MNEVNLLTLAKIWIYSCNQQFIMTNFICTMIITVLLFFSFTFPFFDFHKNGKKQKQMLINITLVLSLLIIIIMNYHAAMEISNEKQISKSIEITNKIKDTNIIQECKKNIITYNNNILYFGISNYINCIENAMYTIKFKQTKNHLKSVISN